MFAKIRRRRSTKEKINLIVMPKIKTGSIKPSEPKKNIRAKKIKESEYFFDEFGKPIAKKYQPNKINEFDDEGDVNYNVL